jgi:hypothetical protein
MTRLSSANLIGLALALISVGLVSIAMIPTQGGGGNTAYEFFAVGCLIGSIFGHAVVASAWSALGPSPAYVRIPLAIFWCLLIWVAVVCNVQIYGGGPPEEITVVMGACITGIWLAVQAPYWLLRWFGRLKIAKRGDALAAAGAPPQFGILQLLIFTSIIAVIFGAGRLAFSFWPSLGAVRGGEGLIFAFLAVAAVVISLPLVPSVLLPRYALPATFICLLLTAAATLIELPLFQQTFSGSPGPQFMHFVWINAANAFWIVAIGVVVRLGGYQLTPRAPIAPKAALR